MGKVKQLTLDRYEHDLAVRALYEEWKQIMEAGTERCHRTAQSYQSNGLGRTDERYP